MRGILQDLRYGLRMLSRNPGITIVAVLSLALGIGVNVANFTLANALLFRPLPVENPRSLVAVSTAYRDNPYNPSSYADYRDLREQNQVFSGLAAYFPFSMGLRTDHHLEIVMGQLVSWNYFDVLGVRPVLGRAFLPKEEQAPNGPSVVILSHRIWQSRFASDPEILGQKVLINAHPFVVVGVAPEDFAGITTIITPDVWVPLTTVRQTMPFPIELDGRYNAWLALVGRLKPGVALESAQTAMDLLATNLEAQLSTDPQSRKSFTLTEIGRIRTGLHQPNDQLRSISILLVCLVSLVLLIACFNVANLLLARATQLRKEMAVRISIGAPRWRILRQCLVESLMLSLLGGGVGMLFARWGIELLLLSIPVIPGFLLEIDASPDLRVLSFALLISVTSGALFGLAPALQMVRPKLLEALTENAQSVTRSRTKSRLQHSLVVAQLAVSVVLIFLAGLFLRSLQNAISLHPGFSLNDGLVAEIDLGYGQYDEQEGRRFFEEAADRVAKLPGVESASLAIDVPLSGMRIQNHVLVEGYEPAPQERMVMRWNAVGDDYFRTLGIPVVEGRAFNDQDREDGRRVAVVNEAMARQYWPGRSAVGGFVEQDEQRWEVIGIAKDGKYDQLNESPQPYVCFPIRQEKFVKRMDLIVSTALAAESVRGSVQEVIQQMDSNLPPPRILTIDELKENATEQASGGGAAAVLVSVFGLLALIIATVGVYGVVAYSVSQRTHEFGIRMAVGARRSEILLRVLREGLILSAAGLLVGLAIAIAVAQVLAGFLLDVSPLDPVSLGGSTLLLVAVAMLASYLPACWASHIDPAQALHTE